MKANTKDLSIKKPRGKSGTKATINISNELSIYNIEGIKKEIDTLLETYESFDISFTNIYNLDLSGIQYIYAIKKEVMSTGKEINFSFDLNSELTNLLVNCGLNEIIKN